MLDKRNFYINCKWVAPVKPNDFEVINPSNEEPFALKLILQASSSLLTTIEDQTRGPYFF